MNTCIYWHNPLRMGELNPEKYPHRFHQLSTNKSLNDNQFVSCEVLIYLFLLSPGLDIHATSLLFSPKSYCFFTNDETCPQFMPRWLTWDRSWEVRTRADRSKILIWHMGHFMSSHQSHNIIYYSFHHYFIHYIYLKLLYYIVLHTDTTTWPKKL